MVGELLNQRYQIERRLGGGSQADVFLATDAHMERLVAIKIWKPEGGFSVEEFLREAKLLARFGAPHFVTIHEHSATSDERPFFVLEYLQGENLQELSTPLTAQEIRRCVRDICVGLQKAHDQGVVHRDLKPSNIMLVDRGKRSERYVILDLGIAKITDAGNWRRTLADATMAGAGTLLYMSPEQCNGNPIDARTDVYAMGCLLFLLLAREEPFADKAASHISVLNAILNDRPRRLADVRPQACFSEELERLVRDCLAKKPKNRPSSMAEVESRFQQGFIDEDFESSNLVDAKQPGDASRIQTRTPTRSSTVRNRRLKRQRAAAVLVALAVVAACGFAFFILGHRPAAVVPLEPVAKSPVPTARQAVVVVPTARPVDSSATVQGPPAAPPSKAAAKSPVYVEDKRPVLPPRKPAPPPPPQINDDRYFVVRTKTLRATDPNGKDKDLNARGVLANDGLLAGKSFEVQCVEKPKFGELTLNGDGTFRYARAAGRESEGIRGDSFKYRVRALDNGAWSEPATVTIVIRPFTDEEEAAIKRVARAYGEAAIRREENPPAVQVDFGEPTVKKRVGDESLNILQGLVEVLRELNCDSQPLTDNALDHLRRFDELRIVSLAGTDVTDGGISPLRNIKSLSEIDLSDTLVTEEAAARLATSAGRAVPLHVIRDGVIDRLRSAGIVISAKNDATLGRSGFVATVPRSDQFQKVRSLLKEAPRLIAVVLSNLDVDDELLTENWVAQLKTLKLLDLRGTTISPQRISLLEKQLPSLHIQWDPPLAQLRLIAAVKESKAGDVSIDLSNHKVDGRTWTLVSQVERLTGLNLSRVPIDDVGIGRLVQLAALQELTLQETPLDGQQVLELCRRIRSLTSLDVRNSAIARDKIVLRALRAELQSHNRSRATVRPEPVEEGPELLAAPFDESAASRSRAAWAAYLHTPEQTVSSIGLKFELIPPGQFRMGSEETYLELVDRFPNVREAEEQNSILRLALGSARPQHSVRITHPYYLAATEVTNAQFKKFLESTGPKTDPQTDGKSGWGYPTKKKPHEENNPGSEIRRLTSRNWGEVSEQAPVLNVSWDDAVAFCDWLSRKEGKIYRLPTEAEWEYACRAGTNTRYWNGDAPERLPEIATLHDQAARQRLYGWRSTASAPSGAGLVSDVGRYPPNSFGLYDMHGNAAEWCSDWFSTSYYRESPTSDPAGPFTGSVHVVRGGSWHSAPLYCRSAYRTAGAPTLHSDQVGFRVVCIGTKPPWPPALSMPAQPPLGKAPAALVAPFTQQQVPVARKAWARYLQIEEQRTISRGTTLLLIPPGEFKMGSTPDDIAQVTRFEPKFKRELFKREQPLHRVRIARPFYLAKHEVTRGEFARFVQATGFKTACEGVGGRGVGFDQATRKLKVDGKYNWRNTGFSQQDNHPVVNISWNDAIAYCKWLTWQEGKPYRLPTESEWEYACRAGTTTLFSSGNDPDSLATIANVADESAKTALATWHLINARDGFAFTAPVGSFPANGFGLFDMHGNVHEWCSDWDADDYYGRSPLDDPPGPSAGKLRISRGGGWTSDAAHSRSAFRGSNGPTSAGISLGFRIAADSAGR